MQKCKEIRGLAWNYLGISRSDIKLLKAQKIVNVLKKEIGQYFDNMPITVDTIELRNIVCVVELIIRSAMQRKESRGLHYNTDYPFMLDSAKDTIIKHKKI
jgi:L-aspartate oxidase